MSSKTFMLMAGGTGGHIFPALAVAQALRQEGQHVIWLGSEGAMETQIVPRHHIHLETLVIKGIRGSGWRRKVALPITLWRCVQAAIHILKKHRVEAVIGFGGFVTVPGGIAAKLLGIPIIIHEQNAVPGLSNKLLSHIARRVLYAFPKVFPDADGLVGNPVRKEMTELAEPNERFANRTGRLKLLIVGGSLGAEALNRILPEALAQISVEKRPNVIHQAGRGKLEALQELYAINQVEAECTEFIDDMASAYAGADLVICRAGALTIAELSAVGVGALLIPYPFAVDDHQTANARFMVHAGAGLLLPQAQLTAHKLAEMLSGLSREQCLQWAERARSLAILDSAREVAKIAIAVVD